MGSQNQIKIYPYTKAKNALFPLASRDQYECANAYITRGVTSTPSTIEECFKSFPSVKSIGDAIGITGSQSLWLGPASPSTTEVRAGQLIDLLTGITSAECSQIKSTLGDAWLGCLWGTPQAPFSCTCPEVGEKFQAYLKHRLNLATFWKTPKNVPVLRQAFLDELKYQTQVEITIAGDFNLHPGMLVEIQVDSLKTKAPNKVELSIFTGIYMIVAVRHVINSGGSHETSLSLSYIPPANEPT